MVLFGEGDVCGFMWGACMVLCRGTCVVLFGGAWFYAWEGGHAWFYAWGACMVLFRGGMHGFMGGGHAWFYSGGMHDRGGVCVVLWGGMCGFIRGACMTGGCMCDRGACVTGGGACVARMPPLLTESQTGVKT